MKFFFHINLIFLVSILTSNTFAQNQIVADLSQENVKISTDFQGAKILLFGAYDGKKGDDIIVIVTGPKGLVTVQKKEKILGVWVNTKKVNYINTPKYLSISSNRKIDDHLSTLGDKSINLPLGEVKITRKVKSLDIIIRTCASVNMLTQNKSRLFEKEKIEYTIRTIRSLLNSFKDTKL